MLAGHASRHSHLNSHIKLTEGDEPHRKSLSPQREEFVGGSSFRDLGSNSTLLVHNAGLNLGSSIDRKKNWKDSQIKPGRAGKQNAARNQITHHYTTNSKDKDFTIYEQLPHIKN